MVRMACLGLASPHPCSAGQCTCRTGSSLGLRHQDEPERSMPGRGTSFQVSRCFFHRKRHLSLASEWHQPRGSGKEPRTALCVSMASTPTLQVFHPLLESGMHGKRTVDAKTHVEVQSHRSARSRLNSGVAQLRSCLPQAKSPEVRHQLICPRVLVHGDPGSAVVSGAGPSGRITISREPPEGPFSWSKRNWPAAEVDAAPWVQSGPI